ncbi:MAG: hypothetical protein QOH58_930 [Thermoleophilaceae bacterium]|jgi:putative nucleotidyltransferase with HDIG domain|nr:hypothetical protein [Thermoleophilaceae bacterium]
MASQVAPVETPGGLPLRRYLPLSVVITLAVTVLPLLAVAQLGPARTAISVALHVLAAMVLSLALARLGAALWTRYGTASSDLVFGDLLLWGWVRRACAEQRLERAARLLQDPDAAETGAREERSLLLHRLSALLEAIDPYTHGHSKRVARHAERIARELGLPREEVARIRAAALVHDVGKVNTPRAILTKPGRLTDSEFAVVKRHPGDGAIMVAELGDPELSAIVRHHHERLDGTGYPDGIAESDIPLGARIIAVADTFDAITSTRAYRRARSHSQAMEVLRQEAGTQLDPDAVTAFVSYYAGRRSVGWVAMLVAAPQRLLSGLGGVPQGLAASAAPIAQAACSVGGIALVGACLGGSPFPSSSAADAGAQRTPQRQLAAQPSGPSAQAPAAAPDRAVPRSERPDEQRGQADSVSAPRTPTTPLALESPDPPATGGGGQGDPDPGTGGGGGGGTGAIPDLPALLPDPADVLRPVSELELPEVQPLVPVPVPSLP